MDGKEAFEASRVGIRVGIKWVYRLLAICTVSLLEGTRGHGGALTPVAGLVWGVGPGVTPLGTPYTRPRLPPLYTPSLH